MTNQHYPMVIIWSDEDDCYLVHFPDFPEQKFRTHGDSYEEALSDVKSAIKCHIEVFGKEVLEDESPILEAFVAEAEVMI